MQYDCNTCPVHSNTILTNDTKWCWWERHPHCCHNQNVVIFPRWLSNAHLIWNLNNTIPVEIIDENCVVNTYKICTLFCIHSTHTSILIDNIFMQEILLSICFIFRHLFMLMYYSENKLYCAVGASPVLRCWN